MFRQGFPKPIPGSWITSNTHPIIEPVSFPCSSFSSCLSCLSCLSMFPNAANRLNGTWSLLPKGHKGPLFHSRLIRPVVGGGGPTYLKQHLGSGEGKPVEGVIQEGHGVTPYNSRRLISTSSMSSLINIDAQDAQDYSARGYTFLSSTIANVSTGIPKTQSQAHGSLRTRTRSSSQSAFSAAASRPVYPVYPVYRCSQKQPTRLTGQGPCSRQAMKVRCFTLV